MSASTLVSAELGEGKKLIDARDEGPEDAFHDLDLDEEVDGGCTPKIGEIGVATLDRGGESDLHPGSRAILAILCQTGGKNFPLLLAELFPEVDSCEGVWLLGGRDSTFLLWREKFRDGTQRIKVHPRLRVLAVSKGYRQNGWNQRERGAWESL